MNANQNNIYQLTNNINSQRERLHRTAVWALEEQYKMLGRLLDSLRNIDLEALDELTLSNFLYPERAKMNSSFEIIREEDERLAELLRTRAEAIDEAFADAN